MFQKICNFHDGLERIEAAIKELKKTIIRPLIVAVAGGSGSGKTTKVAKGIIDIFSEAQILSMDDYFKGISFMKSIGTRNFDEPQVIDLELLVQHLRLLKQNSAVQKPIYSFKTGEREGHERFEPARIIVLDGLFSLHEGVVEEADLRIFVEVDAHGSLIRRILRDVGRTGQTEHDIFKQFAETVYPSYKLYIEPTKSQADIIIVSQYVPETETTCCENKEFQLKAKASGRISSGALKKLGFKKVAEVFQEDTYYTAPGWNLPHCDELMRVRKENNKYFLAYKGPLPAGSSGVKPVIKFEIDSPLKNALETLGYRVLLAVAKKRAIYAGNDIEVVVDRIKSHGYFIEIRTGDLNSRPRIMELFEKLGIDKNSITQKSYLEILLNVETSPGC